MQLCGRIDLHSNSHHLGIIDENQKRIFSKKLPNRKEMILKALMPYREQIEGVVVESTYNWYWLVDRLDLLWLKRANLNLSVSILLGKSR